MTLLSRSLFSTSQKDIPFLGCLLGNKIKRIVGPVFLGKDFLLEGIFSVSPFDCEKHHRKILHQVADSLSFQKYHESLPDFSLLRIL